MTVQERNDYKERTRNAARKFIDEACDDYNVTDPQVQDAMRQAVFRTVGYIESAVTWLAWDISEDVYRQLNNLVKNDPN
jgi:hypothetical protein